MTDPVARDRLVAALYTVDWRNRRGGSTGALADALLAAGVLPPEPPPEGTRLVLVGVEFLSQFGTRTDSGDFITAEWGEPDEHGWYTPTFTAHADDNPTQALRDRVADLEHHIIRHAEIMRAVRESIATVEPRHLRLASSVGFYRLREWVVTGLNAAENNFRAALEVSR
jgi:hypothetical protein